MKIKVDSKGFIILNENIREAVGRTEQEIRNSFVKQAAQLMEEDIVSTIKIGNSPVKGYTRFRNYSESYSNAIRKGVYSSYGKLLRPVNLLLSGGMLKSIAHRVTKRGFTIYFTNKLAKIHSFEGAGKSKVIRKILPDSNGEWKASVAIRAKDLLQSETLKRLVSKLRRL